MSIWFDKIEVRIEEGGEEEGSDICLVLWNHYDGDNSHPYLSEGEFRDLLRYLETEGSRVLAAKS